MITIAIPFFNDEKYLDYAIRSVINQTYENWTLLLVDDGSSDQSLKIARKYAESDTRIRLLSDGENRGLPFRLNQIAKHTTTRYLARMDSDDIMHPERIEKQLKILKQNPQIDVLGSNAYSIDGKNNIRGIRKKITNPDAIERTKGFIHPTITGKTKWFQDNPYDINATRMEDTELWARTHAKSYFANTQLPLLFYREYGDDYYKKYFKTISTRIGILRKNKTLDALSDLLSNIIKYIIYRLFNIAGKEDLLIKRRFSKLNETESDKITLCLRKAVS